MIEWIVQVLGLTREVRKKAADALELLKSGNEDGARSVSLYTRVIGVGSVRNSVC